MALTLVQAVGQVALAQTFTDSANRASLTIVEAPAPLANFTTYTFSVVPTTVMPATEITGIDASFVSTFMNQINPGGSTPTIFNDNNFTISLIGEDPLNDSQFEYSSGNVTTLTSSESSTSLQAEFLFNGNASTIQSSTPFAHFVLPDTGTGTLDLDLSVRVIGVGGEGVKAAFSGIVFGPSAVPEPSMVVALSILTVGAALRGHRGRRRRENSLATDINA